MLPYQTTPDESGSFIPIDWAVGSFPKSLAQAGVSSFPISAYHNAFLVDASDDRDDFMLAGLSPGLHTVYYLPDYVVDFGAIRKESYGGFSLYELNYYTGAGATVYYLTRVGILEPADDTEVIALGQAAGQPFWVGPQNGRLDFVASAPGLFGTTQDLYGGTDRYPAYHTGKYWLVGGGRAFDLARLESLDSATAPEQPGAGRYLLAVDEYEGVRDRMWGTGWLDSFDHGPDTGALVFSGLDWDANGDGTWSASGAATIGLKNGDPDMLSVTNGVFLLTGDSVTIQGEVGSIVEEGTSRPLFSGTAVLALATAGGNILAVVPGEHRLTLAGLPLSVSKLQLTNTGVVLPDVSFELPPDFADATVAIEQVTVTIGSAGIELGGGVESYGTEFLRLLNLVDVKPSYLEYAYDRARDEIAITGKLQVGEDSFFPGLLDATLEGGIRIAGGKVAADVELSIDKVLGIKGYGFNDLELTLSTDDNKVSGSGKFLLPFPTLSQIENGGFTQYPTMQGFYAALPSETSGDPDSWGVGVGVEFLLEPLKFDGIELSAVLPTGIPFFSTPFEVRELGAGVSNLAAENPDPVTFSGLLGLQGISGRIFEAEIELRGGISKERFSGAVEGYLFDEDLVRFQGNGALDWVKDTIEAKLEMTFIDGVITAGLEFKSDFDLNIAARGSAHFELLGAELDGNVYLRISNDSDQSNDYVAVWGTASIELPLLGPTTVSKGLKYTFDGNSPQIFGAEELPVYSSWIVDEGLADLLVTVSWENAAVGPVQTRVVVYDDLAKTQVRQTIEEADYAANGIAVIEQWSGPLGTIVYIAAPEPGLWDVEVVNPEDLGEITYLASTSLAPCNLSVDAVTVDDAIVTIDYTAVDSNAQAELLFFADDDAHGYNGILLGSAPEGDGAGQYAWDVGGFDPGRYWLYVVMDDGQSVPLGGYASNPVRVNLAPNSPPVLASPVADEITEQGAAFAFQLPLGSFTDADAVDTLSYAATLASGDPLPAWLAFDAQTRTFAGVPTAADVGGFELRLTVTDNDGASVSDDFALAVSAVAGRRISGTAGDDLLVGAAGDDTVDGAQGTDTTDFSGSAAQYTIIRTAAGVTVDDRIGRDGSDTLSNVERLRFSDFTVNLTVQGAAAGLDALELQALEELYVAFFNRVPDADGLEYWIGRFKAGESIEQIAESFYNAGTQYLALTGYRPGMSEADFVNTVYRNVLDRGEGADADGLAYWGGELVAGRATNGSLVTDILISAHSFKGDATWGWVADLLDNKIAVSTNFAVDWGLNFNTPQASIQQGMAIADAITPTRIDVAIALIGVSDANISLG